MPSTARISKLLVANRGEIACRVIRTAQRLGIETVSVYSDADRNALHVRLASEAFRIGPAPASQSYLRADRLIDVAKRSGAQAIHPGYGFLSENTEFAELCASSGVTFIGPPANAIRDMGIKNTSKEIMERAGVPVIAGYHGNNQEPQFLLEQARKIGFPVMIKAIRGGGGKGMRIARSEAEFHTQLDSARREALKSFGNDDVLLEQCIEQPRHVEVQVFGDQYGNYLYFFERDCSVQRRHQKVIEEAPAPGISPETRVQLGEAACRAAAAVGYVGAGTVEFIMDAKEKFFFMEMNTRLQVEHPVSEMVTGVDLVELQIRVAEGQPLPMRQDQVRLSGHAFEARIYAEDTPAGFLPTAGRVSHLCAPAAEAGAVRVDSGVRSGDDIGVFYDPMIAKLIVWGPDRPAALQRLCAALRDYQICGPPTNRDFLLALAGHPSSRPAGCTPASSSSTGTACWLRRRPAHASWRWPPSASSCCAARQATVGLADFRLNHAHREAVHFRLGDGPGSKDAHLVVEASPDGLLTVHGGGEAEALRVRARLLPPDERGRRRVVIEEAEAAQADSGSRLSGFDLFLEADGSALSLFLGDRQHLLQVAPPKWRSAVSGAAAGSGSGVRAPMPGVIEKVLVSPGQAVKEGEPLVTLIAMKMEYVVKAPQAGSVAKVLFAEGQTVAKNAELVQFEAASS
uniref:3-methylcrotonyl-CoA carboxylase n=1 Tax=Macrostomum lignano TaxID=282301 RepID=A0A1I8FZ62_9PLAT